MLWGLSGVVVKSSLGATLSAGELLVLRLVGSAGLLALGCAVWRPSAFRLPRAAWGLTALLGVAQTVLQYAYYRAVSATDVGTAVFLEYLAPTLIVIVSWLRGRLAFERWSVVATLTALAGSALLVLGDGAGLQLSALALGFGLLAAATLAGQNLLFEDLLPLADRLPIFLWSTVAAALASLVLGDATVLGHARWMEGRAPFAVGYMIVLATLIPVFLLMISIKTLGAARAGLIVTLEPVIASIAAAALLGEQMRPVQWGGGALILAAVLLMQQAPRVSDRR